jgi:hypothetical protein
VVAMDLPSEDTSAGLEEYAATAATAIGELAPVIIVAQSLGAFTATLLCARVTVEAIVQIAGMVPVPGERGDEWTANTGYPGP